MSIKADINRKYIVRGLVSLDENEFNTLKAYALKIVGVEKKDDKLTWGRYMLIGENWVARLEYDKAKSDKYEGEILYVIDLSELYEIDTYPLKRLLSGVVTNIDIR